MPLQREEILSYHLGGKIGMRPARPLRTRHDLCLAYTPGVATAVREIHEHPAAVSQYTAKENLVAVVTDGTAILGLGDLGAAASIPVMEGKAVLFKAFGDVDGWPVPLNHCRRDGRNEGPTDPERVIDLVCALAPMYGGINLEDIAAPACFEIEDRLDALLDIPVFHDDQWGTAVITLAGVVNYLQLSDRKMGDVRVVINGAGAAGIRIADMLKAAGCEQLVLCDSRGVVYEGRTDLNAQKRTHAAATKSRTVVDAMKGAHIFVGVSVAGAIPADAVREMAPYPAVFAMANPDPEVDPAAVQAALGSRPFVMATGRSDYANQVNNVLGFPFLFRGALDMRAPSISMPMKVAAAEALARVAREPVPEEIQALYPDEHLVFGPEYVIPKPFDRRLFEEVSYAVASAAVEEDGGDPLRLQGYRELLMKRNQARLGLQE